MARLRCLRRGPFHIGSAENWKDDPVLIHAAIEISPTGVRTRVSSLRPTGADGLVDRFVSVVAEQGNLDRIAAIVTDGAEAARSAGAGSVEVVLTPELRGTRFAKLLERRVAPNVAGFRSPGTGARIARRFMAATAGPSGQGSDAVVGVAGVGHSSLGIAVGRRGGAPEWIGSRPFGLERVASRARFQDPPTPVQLEVAKIACARSLETLQPPDFETLLVVSDFEPSIADLCGSEVTNADLDGALEWVLGRTSDELVAVTGLGRPLARLLPAAIVVHQALIETFRATLIPVAPDPAAEVALADLAAISNDRGARA